MKHANTRISSTTWQQESHTMIMYMTRNESHARITIWPPPIKADISAVIYHCEYFGFDENDLNTTWLIYQIVTR